MPITIAGPVFEQAAVCIPIVRALPDWFGIEAAIAAYEHTLDQLPTLLAYDAARAVGFVSLQQHTPYAAEVAVMGVLPELHRRGVGRALLESAQIWLRTRAVEFLQVKTLGPSHPDAGYARTRAFYAGLGFRPLEELPQIWGADNPCLIMVKRLI